MVLGLGDGAGGGEGGGVEGGGGWEYDVCASTVLLVACVLPIMILTENKCSFSSK